MTLPRPHHLLLLLLAAALLAGGATAHDASAAKRKLRCSSGTTEYRSAGVRMFAVTRSERIDGVRFVSTEHYLCSRRLRRPVLVYTGDEGTDAPAALTRFRRHLSFAMTTIGGAGSGTDYCWADVVTGATRCAGFDDELAIAEQAAVRDDGAMTLLLRDDDAPGVVLFFRNGTKRFGRPVALGRITTTGKLRAFALTETAVTWTGADGSAGQLPLTARCPEATCPIVADLGDVSLTGTRGR